MQEFLYGTHPIAELLGMYNLNIPSGCPKWLCKSHHYICLRVAISPTTFSQPYFSNSWETFTKWSRSIYFIILEKKMYKICFILKISMTKIWVKIWNMVSPILCNVLHIKLFTMVASGIWTWSVRIREPKHLLYNLKLLYCLSYYNSIYFVIKYFQGKII